LKKESRSLRTARLPLLALLTFGSRRRLSLVRPSAAGQKFQSILTQSQANQLPPFTFGAGGNGATKPSMSLEECFEESPPQERFKFASPGRTLSRPRTAVRLSSCPSPMQGLSKRSAAPMGRPRKQFRRTLSMYEHPGDVMNNEKKHDIMEPIMDVDESPLKLPSFIDQPGDLPRIALETIISVLNGEYGHLYDSIMVVDCRFEYEYSGGHINGADNFNDKEELARKLFAQPTLKSTLIVLHCEYSAHRAPLM
jgi:hypothetical protein